MRKWSALLCMTLAVGLAFGGMTAWAAPSQSDEGSAAGQINDNLDYDNLENLIKKYNPGISYAYKQLDLTDDEAEDTVRSLKDSIEENDYKGQLKEAREKKKQLEQMPDFDGKEEAIKAADAGIKMLKNLLDTPSTTIKSTDKQIENARKQIDTNVKQVLMGTQRLMISYDNLRAQIQFVEKTQELQKEALEAAKRKEGLGMSDETASLLAQSDLLATGARLESLRNLANGLRSQLCLATGWQADATPEIGTAPAADPSQIAAIDFSADLQKAIGNNQTLISQRHGSSSKSSSAVDNRLKNLDVSQQQLTVEMQRLYQAVQQKKALNDAAETAYQKALLAKEAAESQYQMKMLGRLQYLAAEVQYYEAESAKKSADTALLQAMLDYGWAVQGFVDIPQ